MEPLISNSFQKNFHPLESSTQSGLWNITPKVDLVSEKKYLVFQLQFPDHMPLDKSTIIFRAQAAENICPGKVAKVLAVHRNKDGIELLTPYFEVLEKTKLDGQEVEELIHSLLSILLHFEAFRFVAYNLSLCTFGRDEKGRFSLLPNALIFPGPEELDERKSSEAIHKDLGDFRYESYESINPYHLKGLKRIVEELSTHSRDSKAGYHDLLKKLFHAMEKSSAKKASFLPDMFKEITGESPNSRLVNYIYHRPSPDKDQLIGEVSDQILNLSMERGGIVLLKGKALSGKSAIIKMAAEKIMACGDLQVKIPDSWDLFSPLRRKNNIYPMEKTAIFIDNIDERAFIYSKIADAVYQKHLPEGALLVLSTDPSHTSKEASEFLKMACSVAQDRFYEIDLNNILSVKAGLSQKATGSESQYEKPLKDKVSSIRALLQPDLDTGEDGSPIDMVTRMLGDLKEQEKQILEFLSISRFDVPIDMIFSLFPGADGNLCRAIQHMLTLGLIELRYKFSSPGTPLSIFTSMKNNSMGRLVYLTIPRARKKNLSKTIPVLAEEYSFFPPFNLLHHLLQGEERAQAAKLVVSYMKKHRDASRPRFFSSLTRDLLNKGLFDALPFEGKIFMLREISEDMLQTTDRARAEELLLSAIKIISATEMDKRIKQAPLIISICRLLADLWEGRGEYKRALDLLSGAREILQSFLPLQMQARLMNDIGWLHYRLGDYEHSLEFCKLSLTSLNPNQYPVIVAQALNIMGVVHFNTSRYDEAISYYEQSVFLREKAGDSNALSASYNNLGLVYQTKGEYEKALDYYNKSLEIKAQQKNLAGIAAGNLNLALLYLEMHNFSEAEEKCKKSREISKSLGNAQLMAENLSTMGDIELKRGSFDKAEKLYLESLKLCRKIETINEEMGALRRLSSLCLLQKRYSEAEDHIGKASKLAMRIGSKFESAQIDMIIGELQCTQKKFIKSLKHYERAASSFTTLSKYHLAAKALAKIGLIHAESNNSLEARQFLDRAMGLIRSDIGLELPEELVNLQQTLSRSPIHKGLKVKTSQKMMMAFYELSSLSDYTLDRNEFFKKALDIVKQILIPQQCFLALKEETGKFSLFDCKGELTGYACEGEILLFSRTLLLGCLLENSSPDVLGIVPKLNLPSGMGFVSIPLKAMGEDLGCLLLYFNKGKLPLPQEEATFFTSLGRQIAGNLRLMLHFEEHLHKEEQLEQEFEDLKAEFTDRYRFENLIGKSEEMKKIFRTLNKIKNMIPGILIIGESGTGKTELARAIHYNGQRRNKPFQEIHCAQIPTTLLESELFGHERGAFTGAVQKKLGLCELADGGTIFLDDINVISTETQTKLLHFLESKSFMRVGGTKKITSNVRIIAASNEDLEKLCKEQKFREDLYYRLKVILITIPPLRKRKEDIVAISLAFLKKKCNEKAIPLKTLAPETIKLFQKAPWRGNVRELQNVLERVVLLSDENIIYVESLPEDFLKEVSGSGAGQRQSAEELVDNILDLESYSETNPLMPQMEALFARKMVEHIKAKGRAASLLGITKPTLYSRLEKYKRLNM